MEKAGMQRKGLVRRGILHPNISAEPRDCWLYAKAR
jgi:[ribosomal protein S5]-alanine N-acetyltransferase